VANEADLPLSQGCGPEKEPDDAGETDRTHPSRVKKVPALLATSNEIPRDDGDSIAMTTAASVSANV